MKQQVLEDIHKNTISLLTEVNKQIDLKDDRFFYNNVFYSGTLTPEILFVGYNPGYGIDNWKDRVLKNEDFRLENVKYISEKNERLGSQIHFLLATIFNNPKEILEKKVAETNFIHFNTPTIQIYNKSLKKLTKDSKEKLENHFIHSFRKIIELTEPKVIYIIGKSTFDQLSKKIDFESLKILEKDKINHLICAKTKLKQYPKINIIVSKHLSAPISDSNIGSIGNYLKEMLQEKSKKREPQ